MITREWSPLLTYLQDILFRNAFVGGVLPPERVSRFFLSDEVHPVFPEEENIASIESFWKAVSQGNEDLGYLSFEVAMELAQAIVWETTQEQGISRALKAIVNVREIARQGSRDYMYHEMIAEYKTNFGGKHD